MKKITWHIETRALADLKEADYNPRTRTPKEKADLKRSIDSFGAVEPGVINIGKRENVLIGGHGRREIYLETGRTEMQVMVPDRELTEDEEMELNLRLNKNTGSWDHEKLAELGIDILLEVGFGEEELAGSWDDVDVIDDNFRIGAAMKEAEKPRTKEGDLWELGGHRLYVGDATDPEAMKALMGKDLADLIHIDAPKTPEVKDTAKRTDATKPESAYLDLIEEGLVHALAAAKPNVHVFHWVDEARVWMVQELMREHKLRLERLCIWIRPTLWKTPKSAFNKAFEPCVYAVRGKPYLAPGQKNETGILNREIESGNQMHSDILETINLWADRRPKQEAYDDPTMPLQRPVSLMERPLKRCTGPGAIVLDPYGGSGAMLIAAHQLGRKARILEADPVMATVILNRWEVFSNQKAKRI
jgi:hypothetical protein